MQSYKIRNNQKLFSAFNHSPMGYSLPASIGAQFAAFGERIVCITGDGGMCMNIQELETIVYNNLPVKIFLINNKGYGIIRQTQDTWMNSNYVGVDKNSGLGFPNIKGIAQAYGVPTIDINDHSDLNETIRYVLNYDGYILCNVNVKPDEQILPKLVFGHGIEDMSPLLPRDELKEIMNNEENTTNTK
jgi:acetolactate synthase-1/2/3 large subunit